ncbi:Retrovirus-related Pol polyprotein from transposon [Ceratobasidium sp. AG-Ba]|nr:Retrovirus-related Pol polyprotein from transposon [Ceratobasidium sp. AG-Ba]
MPGAFPTPVSLVGPKVSTPPVPSPNSSSPSLESLILAEASGPSTPALVSADLPAPSVPFPSPGPGLPSYPIFSPSTPTPTPRVRRLAKYSNPPCPSLLLVDCLSRTYIAPVPIVTVSTPQLAPPPSQPAQTAAMTSKEAQAARANLTTLPRFNDDMDPMRKVKWWHNFTVATRGVPDNERAQLWSDWLVFQGVAFDWYESLQKKGPTELADSKSWSKLLTHIESCWPTLVRDLFALAERKRHRWDNSVLRVKDMLATLQDESNPVKLHEVWAKQHYSQGKDRGSLNDDLVHDTIKQSIPPWVVALLPKRTRYGSDFEGLCKDIGELSVSKILNAYSVHQAVAAFQNLALGTPAKPAARTAVNSSYSGILRRTPSQTSLVQDTKPPQTPISAPSFGPARNTHFSLAPPRQENTR